VRREGGDLTTAGQQLQADTQIRQQGMQDASQERIAAGDRQTREALAGAPTGAPTAQQQALKSETLRLVNELLGHPGREDATGVSGEIMNRIPGSDAKGFGAKVDRLKSIMTLDNLKLLKGAMSDKDLLFLQSIPAALQLGMKDDEVKSELQRIQTTLAGETAPAGGGVMTATNPQTGQKIRSTDGGRTWQ
jgi:hypothetical protein